MGWDGIDSSGLGRGRGGVERGGAGWLQVERRKRETDRQTD